MSRTTFPPLEDDFTRALLRSAESDEPSSAAYAKAATALGVGAGLGVGASLAAPSLVAAGVAGAARWSSSTAVRLWAFGVSGALLVGGGALLLNARAADGARANAKQGVAVHAVALPQAPAASPLAELGALAVPAASPAAASPEVEPPGSVPAGSSVPSGAAGPSLPSAQSVPSEAVVSLGAASAALVPQAEAAARGAEARTLRVGNGAVRRVARPAQAAPGSSLAEQVQSLDRARVALGSGDAGTALREIAYYRKAWPRGVFLTEASVLEIEALAARGERSLAAARAAAFVAAQPDSPQAERLRRLIPASKP